MEIEEPPIKEKILKVKNFWKKWQTKKEIKVASGPPPTLDESPPIDPLTGEPVVTQDHFMDAVDRAEGDDKKG